MCGIIGIAGRVEHTPRQMERALARIGHRGPDNQSIQRVHPHLILGHARLNIVDCHERANQPMMDPKTGNCIVFNGEIYNYQSLRRFLPNRQFLTRSDTETLLYLLSDLGVDATLDRLNGMFAFAFWDHAEQTLLLVRDRIGVKPLFTCRHAGALYFASEVKAFGPLGISLSPNETAVINFLFERSIGRHHHSFFKEVSQVPPGTRVVVDCREKALPVRRHRFWRPPETNLKIPYRRAVEELRSLLDSAVDIRLSSEVPYAFLLSGGLDSSSILSLAARKNPDQSFMSVSAVYPNDPSDESRFAQHVLDRYPNIRKRFVKIEEDRFRAAVREVIYHQETPIADGSMVSHYLLMKEIGKMGIKLVLTGSGGDEVLAGYQHTMMPAMAVDQLRRMNPGVLRHVNPVKTTFHALPDRLKQHYKLATYRRLKFLKDPARLGSVYPYYQPAFYRGDRVNYYLAQFLTQWSLPGFLWYEDRNSMAHSIEARAPFMDYRLVDFLLGIDGSHKINAQWSKRILRDALDGVLPDPVRLRRAKQGFYAPIQSWGRLMDTASFEDRDFAAAFHYLDIPRIRRSDFSYRWRLFALCIWYDIFWGGKGAIT